jgi:CheY-like chemotaxis protein
MFGDQRCGEVNARGSTVWRIITQIALSVRDTGTGIPVEMLPRVFDLFTQIDRTLGRARGGLGIGLALVRSLVELHGGSVEVHSDGIGRGSEFIVRLPLAAGSSGAGTDEKIVVHRKAFHATDFLAGRRILVVDDNRDAADTLGMLLKHMGAEARMEYDGPSALEAIPIFQPAVVFLDIGMPGMDGYAVGAQVRRSRQNGVRLIALTGWGQEEDRRLTREAGFDYHLIKPPDAVALRDLLRLLFSEVPA